MHGGLCCTPMSIQIDSTEFTAALTQASEELGLPDYYRSCVRPLFMMPITQWPTCCAGRCDPCAQTLVAVASRICDLLGIDRESLPNASETVRDAVE